MSIDTKILKKVIALVSQIQFPNRIIYLAHKGLVPGMQGWFYIYWTVHFKMVDLIICKFHINKNNQSM